VVTFDFLPTLHSETDLFWLMFSLKLIYIMKYSTEYPNFVEMIDVIVFFKMSQYGWGTPNGSCTLTRKGQNIIHF
jgi:hypothetical protein